MIVRQKWSVEPVMISQGSGVFLSYRRDDAAGHAGRLADTLAERFGSESVFLDVDCIEPGADFVAALTEALGRCRVVLVVVGTRWIDAEAGGRRRLDDPDDFVRMEIETALQQGLRVVPVLVGGAAMPPREHLPAALEAFARCNAFEMNDRAWNDSSRVLLDLLARWFESDETAERHGAVRDERETEPGLEGFGPRRSALPPALARATTTTLAGRANEIAALASLWSQACAPSDTQSRPAVFVSGEPGIGKTRLVAELAASAFAAGSGVYYGRSDEDGGSAFTPWLPVVAGLVADAPTALLHELRRETAELQRVCPNIGARVSLPPIQVADMDGERDRLFAALATLLTRTSQLSPALIILDDLHWADRSSLMLLSHLAGLGGDGRFLVVGTYRDTDLERGHPLSGVLARLRSDRCLERITLRELDLEATTSLIDARTGHAVDTDLAEAVFREAGGNPFFVEEVCAHLLETDGARLVGGRLTAADGLSRVGIPEGVRDVLGRRFARLSSVADEALRIAAVIGREFDLDVLEQLLPEPHDVLGDIEQAIAIGLVREGDGRFGAYEFTHALIRTALADEISSVRRVRLHRAIATAIERSHPEPTPVDIDRLAYHYTQAAADGDVAKAVEYTLLAAEQAVDRAAFDEARAQFDRGLEIVELARGDATAAHAELLIALAELLCRTNDWETARDLSNHAVDVARRSGSATLFARAVRTRATWAPSGPLDAEAVDLATEALAWLDGADEVMESQLRATGVFHRGVAGELLESDDDLSTNLLVDARRIGNWKALRDALFARHWLLQGRPEIDERLRVADELVELVTGHRDVFYCAGAHQARAGVMLVAGDRAGYQRDSAESQRIGAEFGSPEISAAAFACGTTEALISGRFTESEQRLDAFLTQFPDVLPTYSAQLFWLRAEQGRLEEIRELLGAFAGQYPIVVPMLAFTQARIGDRGGARATLLAATADNFAPLHRDWSWPVALGLLAETAVIVGADEPIAALSGELEPYRGQMLVLVGSVLCIGAADRYLAMLDGAARRDDRARTGFAAAAELERRLDAPALLARTRLWQGRAQLSDAAEADATDSLTQASELAASFGMHDLAENARALLGP